jgi:hypothetical protein
MRQGSQAAVGVARLLLGGGRTPAEERRQRGGTDADGRLPEEVPTGQRPFVFLDRVHAFTPW